MKILPYDPRKKESVKVTPTYLWYNAYTGKYFRSYFTKNYHNSLFIYQIK